MSPAVRINIVMPREPIMKHLAQLFTQELRDTLKEWQWNEVVRKNHTPKYGPGICASHDYCDANMIMAAAWEKLFGTDEIEADNEEHAKLWGDAWTYAKDKLIEGSI